MVRQKHAMLYQIWSYVVVFLMMLTGCGSSQQITIKSFGLLDTGGTCVQGKGVGVVVEVDNPEDRPLMYNWITTRGVVRTSSESAPSGTYECPGPAGTETITIQVMSDGRQVAQKSIQIEVIPAPVAVEQPTP